MPRGRTVPRKEIILCSSNWGCFWPEQISRRTVTCMSSTLWPDCPNRAVLVFLGDVVLVFNETINKSAPSFPNVNHVATFTFDGVHNVFGDTGKAMLCGWWVPMGYVRCHRGSSESLPQPYWHGKPKPTPCPNPAWDIPSSQRKVSFCRTEP